jgi:3-hydroxyacyl-CoA dehydrogenase / enoyl-CoA hydratase / 3-hydroxybutyryl-CoA epimerase
MTTNLTLNVDAEGIATLTFDVPGRSMNVLSAAVLADFAAAVGSAVADPAVRGLLLASAKPSFMPGADLTELVQQFERRREPPQAAEDNAAFSRLLRRLETCGKPVAVAINGIALGGGLEICLACHYRVLADDPKAVIGLPEVTVGLLPGGGGTQRLPRLIGLEKALPLLLEGTSLKPAEALRLGVVHEVVPQDQVVAVARRWLLGSPFAQQPWDRKGYVVPGGASLASPPVGLLYTVATARVARATMHNYPAPIAILSAVFEGTQLPIDRGLAIELKYFAKLVTGPVARNLIRTMFVNKGLADKLARRPEGVAKTAVRKLGVLGAGMMGAGIAFVAAKAGVDCVLLDETLPQAEKGKAYAVNQLRKELEKGRTTQDKVDAILARILPTADYAALAGCDLVVEAVFENRVVKAGVTKQAEAVIPAGAVFASNTSTLPISGLAEASKRPKQFIGIHFFSPVDRMPLVEVIVGRKTSPGTVAMALDFVGQLRKTPIVVNDSRNFYTSRVFGTFCHEGRAMLEEGIDPALIENAARAAGMPVGPLSVADEVSLELQWKVLEQTREDLGAKYQPPVGLDVLRRFVVDLKRLGRKSGGGFYDYPAGGRKHLWPGLSAEYPRAATQPSVDDVRRRLMFIQALETARCFEEGVVTSAAEADLGSVLGWGFPAYTGGTLSFADAIGLPEFVRQCQQLARAHGPRFKPPRGLVDRARRGEAYHSATLVVPAP